MSLAIAITPRSEVAGHFGKAAAFLVFDDAGQLIHQLDNRGSREIGCKHKKMLQRQLGDLGVREIVLGNVGQRSLARLLNAGFKISRVPPRSPVSMVLDGEVAREELTAPEQGRPCKREKGDCGCGCGCGSKKKAQPAKVGTMMHRRGMNRKMSLSGLNKIGGLKL
ncbi:NifB/NifX family molybdenum-iron cluster-binding protein [uncultured Photobacterium sp.]|uniref:NifB/NifX family molybdenum-iron cluster-binding protein n=1 Tax=uncultured Photobacterium sp. TaxID=173973 RepID=UPI002614974F|nr:NifB/NifX family molybdenum-iron cluster-binding protein [uncultured Photobacterium sp.]